jgi:hypothetical protein
VLPEPPVKRTVAFLAQEEGVDVRLALDIVRLARCFGGGER